MVLYDRRLNLYESNTIFARKDFTGTEESKFQILSGARLLFSFLVTRIDAGAKVTFKLWNGFSQDQPYEVVLQPEMTTVSFVKQVLTDFNNLFKLEVIVEDGTADLACAVMVFDNAGTTRIDNAILKVDLDHTVDANGHFDSIRIGDGADLLGINPDGSININIQQPANLKASVIYDEKPAVGSGTETVITTFTVPNVPNKKAWLQKVAFSGENIATFKAYLNGAPIAIKRVHYGCGFSGEFVFNGTTHDGVLLSPTDVVQIKARHDRSASGNFEAAIHVVETI